MLKKRRSVRYFSARKVDEGIIIGAIEAAVWAPSAGNVQDKKFIVIRDKDKKQSLVPAVYDQVWIARAPVILVILSDVELLRLKFENRAEFYATIGVGAAMENVLLYLASKGLQGVNVGLFDELMVKRILKIPEKLRVFSIIAFGYPAEIPPTPKRIDIKNVTYLEEYGKTWVKGVIKETHLI